MSRFPIAFVVVSTYLIVMLIGGCSTKNAGTQEVPGGLSASSAPVPDGVDAGVWAMLTTELARVVSETGKTASTPPQGTGNGPQSLMAVDNGNGTVTLTWTHLMIGDTDQNGEVNIGDLTPIGMHYSKSNTSADWAQAQVADTDGNGQVNINDVTPIGQHYQETVSLYGVFAAQDSSDYPTTPDGANGGGTREVGEIDFASGSKNVNGQMVFTFTDIAPLAGDYYWVRGEDSTSGNGSPSNWAQAGSGGSSWNFVMHPSTLANSGTGAELDPFILNVDGYYALQVVDPSIMSTVTDQVTFTSSNPQSVGVNALGEIEMAGGYSDPFDITASKAGQVINPQTLFFAFGGGGQNTAPTAAYTASNDIGVAPLDIDFDASTSSDPDAGDSITQYEWDFDGDGTYDHTTTETTVQRTFKDVGQVFPVLRVTDSHGATDTFTLQVTVTMGYSWSDTWIKLRGEFVSIALNGNGNPCIAASRLGGIDYMYGDATDGGNWTEVDDMVPALGIDGFAEVSMCQYDHPVNGTVPVLAYTCRDAIDGKKSVMLAMATDANGSVWSAPVLVAYDVEWLALDMITQPGKIHVFYVTSAGNLVVVTSEDHGAGFGSITTLDDTGNVTFPLSATIGNNISVVYKSGSDLLYRGTTDTSSFVWNTAKTIATGGVYWTFDVAFVSGNPAVVYVDSIDSTNYHSPIYYIAAADPTGTTWASPVDVRDTGWKYSREVTLVDINGRPAVVYANDSWNGYTRAHDSQGLYWQVVETPCNGNNWYADMICSAQNRPLVVFGQDAGAVIFATY